MRCDRAGDNMGTIAVPVNQMARGLSEVFRFSGRVVVKGPDGRRYSGRRGRFEGEIAVGHACRWLEEFRFEHQWQPSDMGKQD